MLIKVFRSSKDENVIPVKTKEWKRLIYLVVLSLVAAPEDLFGGEKGIYVTGDAYDEWYQSGVDGGSPLPNFEQTGKEWEREASFELYEETENVLQQTVGIRIQGNSTRNSEDKRFNVFTRPEYDAVSTSFFYYPIVMV